MRDPLFFCMLDLRFNYEDISMVQDVNPFTGLVRMLEQRLKRQNEALSETKTQLEGALKSQTDWQADWLKSQNTKK